MNCASQCYVIGGPWIAEDPDCPVHGHEAQRLERERDARIAELERERDERLTDRQVEDFASTLFFAWAVWYHDQQTRSPMERVLRQLQGVAPFSVSDELREFRKTLAKQGGPR